MSTACFADDLSTASGELSVEHEWASVDMDPRAGTGKAIARAAVRGGRTVWMSQAINETISSIKALKDLPPGWDGGNAQPIDSGIVRFAFSVIGRLDFNWPRQPAVVPMSAGRFQLEWHSGHRSLEIEFETDSMIHYLKWDGDIDSSEEDVAQGESKAAATLDRLVEWFFGIS